MDPEIPIDTNEQCSKPLLVDDYRGLYYPFYIGAYNNRGFSNRGLYYPIIGDYYISTIGAYNNHIIIQERGIHVESMSAMSAVSGSTVSIEALIQRMWQLQPRLFFSFFWDGVRISHLGFPANRVLSMCI